MCVAAVIEMLTQPKAGTSRLHLRPVPRSFRGTFGELFEKLLSKDGVQAIGLYRAKTNANGALGEYVYTKPNLEAHVNSHDMVFVLGQTDAT